MRSLFAISFWKAEGLLLANVSGESARRQKFEYDFYLLGKRTLVEVDGDYWHAHPDKFPELDATQKWNRGHDSKKNELAERLGLRLVRVWESDVMNEEQLTKVIEGLR